MRKFFILLIFCISTQIQANPFAIKFSAKTNVTNEDYIEIQRQLREINIISLINNLYMENKGYNAIQGFLYRSSRGIRRVLIDPKMGSFRFSILRKLVREAICVSFPAPLTTGRVRYCLPLSQRPLTAVALMVHFYYRLGGFPNPTGKEIQYAGVPYCFKVFLMLEAQKLGFNNVLWIDSACLPLRNPAPLFQWLDQTGIYFHGCPSPPEDWKYIFSATRQLLIEETGTDVLHSIKMTAPVFGLKMNVPETSQFVEVIIHHLVELGTPFYLVTPKNCPLSLDREVSKSFMEALSFRQMAERRSWR